MQAFNIKVVGKMNPRSNQRYIVYDKDYLSPTIQAAAGTGGGQVPFIIVIDE